MLETDIISEIKKSKKYSRVCDDLIEYILKKELEKKQKEKQTIKNVKTKLHQIGGAFIGDKPKYNHWLEEIKSCKNEEELKLTAKKIMRNHSSTNERLPFIEKFYETIFDNKPKEITDLACGLNPVGIPFMNLSKNTKYYGIDIYKNMIDFLNEYSKLTKVNAKFECQNLLNIKKINTDTCLILKTLPLLEQIQKGSSAELLSKINAKRIVISFPTKSISGKEKGMKQFYTQFFEEFGKDNYEVKEFPNEIVFILSKS